MPQPPSVTQNILSAASGNAWYNYPWTDDYAGKEPFGNFPKPDINIQNIPAKTPITALAQGVVTNVDTTSPWGCAVTIKMDQPYNAVATHTAYLHLSGTSVAVGQHVVEGQQIGVGGGNQTCGSQQVPVGFAFYNGDQYGYGSTWNQYVGSPQLNPVSFLSTFKSASPSTLAQANTIIAAQGSSNCDTPIVGWFICQLPQFFARVGLFLVGLVFLIIGGIMLIHPEQPVGDVIKGAAKAGAA